MNKVMNVERKACRRDFEDPNSTKEKSKGIEVEPMEGETQDSRKRWVTCLKLALLFGFCFLSPSFLDADKENSKSHSK